jgi:threonyl-tRNA synthetase
MWDTAETQLRAIMQELKLDYYEAKGEAAFYGPKIDIQIRTALNHDVTIPTCQLDFALPERFELTYIGEDGKEHRPDVIHRAVLGSTERFMSFLIEETKGNFPLWLAPHQVKILPVSDKFESYAKKVCEEIAALGFRVDVDDRNEKLGYKIREAQLMKVPYMLIVGEKEEKDNLVSVRGRKEGDLGQLKLDEFKKKIVEKLKNKKIDRN